MCLIIAIPKGKKVEESWLKEGFVNNPEGAGYMFVDEKNELVIRKPFFKLKNFLREFIADRAIYRDTSPFVVHFRIGTSGQKNVDNTHPFQIKPNIGFCHNGILSGGTAKKSDTVVFAELLSGLPDGFHKNASIMELIDRYAKMECSKFCFLTAEKEIIISNAKQGISVGDIWFSNTTYLKSRVITLGDNRFFNDRRFGFSDDYACAAIKTNPKDKTETIVNLDDEIVDEDGNIYPNYEQCYNCGIWLPSNEMYEIGEDAYICSSCFLESRALKSRMIGGD